MRWRSRTQMALADAVEWIGTVRDELVMAGFPGGDRTVALANLRALVKERDALREAIRPLVYGEPGLMTDTEWLRSLASDDDAPTRNRWGTVAREIADKLDTLRSAFDTHRITEDTDAE